MRSHDDPRYAVPTAIDEFVKKKIALREAANPWIKAKREMNVRRDVAAAKAARVSRAADADRWIAELRARKERS